MFSRSSVVLAVEINLSSCLGKQADNGTREIDHTSSKPNSDFTSLLAWVFLPVSGMLVIVGDSGIDFLCFTQPEAKCYSYFIPSFTTSPSFCQIPQHSNPEYIPYRLSFSQDIIYVTALELDNVTFNLTKRPWQCVRCYWSDSVYMRTVVI